MAEKRIDDIDENMDMGTENQDEKEEVTEDTKFDPYRFLGFMGNETSIGKVLKTRIGAVQNLADDLETSLEEMKDDMTEYDKLLDGIWSKLNNTISAEKIVVEEVDLNYEPEVIVIDDDESDVVDEEPTVIDNESTHENQDSEAKHPNTIENGYVSDSENSSSSFIDSSSDTGTCRSPQVKIQRRSSRNERNGRNGGIGHSVVNLSSLESGHSQGQGGSEDGRRVQKPLESDEIPRIAPPPGMEVYAPCTRSGRSHWKLATVVKMCNNDEYDIQFVNATERADRGVLRFPARELAYNINTADLNIGVGTRVLARRDQTISCSWETAGKVFGGIVAESQHPWNQFRYLIFFDSGVSQYTSRNDVFLVIKHCPEIWRDVSDEPEFVEKYIEDFRAGILPRFPRLSNGSLIGVKRDGTWQLGKVVKTDCSLFRIRFQLQGHNQVIEESIYRMSQRLSTNVLNGINNFKQIPECEKGLLQWIPFEGKVKSLSLPVWRDVKEPIDHTCSESCLVSVMTSGPGIVSPLAIPLLAGFRREVKHRVGGLSQGFIVYSSPCGQVFDCMEDLHDYLQMTNSELGVDKFSFDVSVECIEYFESMFTTWKIPDVSFGKESIPIQCVNSVDGDKTPASIKYLKNCKPGKGVTWEKDPDFLSCCDCQDDCQDRSKCQCWQLTLRGYSFRGDNVVAGYEFRRLECNIPSAIFECNSRCSCRKTCLNKVIQNGISFPLEVFKTKTKGWAVRTLVDIPTGSFISEYSGLIITDQAANSVKNDVYLANLDYVRVKEGYEELFVEPSTSSRKGNSSEVVPERDWAIQMYYGVMENLHCIDGGVCGNVGRYYNHSCNPNSFVQSVFVDTHDIRFPWIAVFAKRTIKAGEELTWDYNYRKVSNPRRAIPCYCGESNCRGRLR